MKRQKKSLVTSNNSFHLNRTTQFYFTYLKPELNLAEKNLFRKFNTKWISKNQLVDGKQKGIWIWKVYVTYKNNHNQIVCKVVKTRMGRECKIRKNNLYVFVNKLFENQMVFSYLNNISFILWHFMWLSTQFAHFSRFPVISIWPSIHVNRSQI